METLVARLLMSGHPIATATGTVAGTVMAAKGSNTDEDFYYLGYLNAGAVVVPST